MLAFAASTGLTFKKLKGLAALELFALPAAPA